MDSNRNSRTKQDTGLLSHFIPGTLIPKLSFQNSYFNFNSNSNSNSNSLAPTSTPTPPPTPTHEDRIFNSNNNLNSWEEPWSPTANYQTFTHFIQQKLFNRNYSTETITGVFFVHTGGKREEVFHERGFSKGSSKPSRCVIG